ncbi:MAG: HisS family protein [Chloroflexi bacterium]|nr:HisS family protein [Chloroflexota bacterium]
MSNPREQSLARQRVVAGSRMRLERFLQRRGYQPIATPMIEPTDLFLKKSGGELAARMYSFTDPSGRRVSLRPEFTSSVVQAFVDGALPGPLPQRWCYSGPVFRYDRGGDSGEIEQLGAELIGAGGVAADAEMLALAVQGLTVLGVRGHRLRIGHVGVVSAMYEAIGLSERSSVFLMGSLAALRSGDESPESVRGKAARLRLLAPESNEHVFRITREMAPEDAAEMVRSFVGQSVTGSTGQRTPDEILRRYLKKLRQADEPGAFERGLALCVELARAAGPAARVRGRLARIASRFGLAKKVLAPLEGVLDALEQYDLRGVPVLLDLGLARGLAYYTGVQFDIEHSRVRGAHALGGGGRYDDLIGALGGSRSVPAIGFAYGLDHVARLLPQDFAEDDADGPVQVLVTAQEASFGEAVAVAERLRAQGIPTELDLQSKNDAAAAKYARQRGIETIMRVGQDGRVAEQFV